MLNISSKNSDGCGIDARTRSIKFLTNLFRRKKPEETLSDMEKGSQSVTVARVPSTLSVRDILVSAYPSSPSLSTPARARDIDSDMETLRISRHDNPFLKQVLASRESLADSLEESESDDTNLMSQEFSSELDADPLSLPEVHEHMIRSPPPTSWPRSPNFKMFRFPDDGSSVHEGGSRKSPLSRSVSPRQETKPESFHEEVLSKSLLSPRNFSSRPHQRSSSDIRERKFTLLTPAPLRSLTDVRRLNVRCDEDAQRLVSADLRQ
uniref:Ribosomal protein S12 methylthiotransferase RimO n=2 Tax=Lygus hesperus TaxID=30085 RepID=A0A0A9XZ02_LYGHE